MQYKKSTKSLPFSFSKSNLLFYLTQLFLIILSFITRLHTLSLPKHVCWDETHFGKHANFYINRTFFFDVHPPLGKMLLGLVGHLNGYAGDFAFESPGDDYNSDFYLPMRFFCTVLGAFLPPLCFNIVWRLTQSVFASLMAGTFVLLDTGTITLTQYILLDSPLLFFIILSAYGLFSLHSEFERPFTFWWYFWMSLTGIGLSGAMSVKWVGALTILYAGVVTLLELWRILGDNANDLLDVIIHFLIRIVLLIILPVFLYCGIFAIHFELLNRTGNGDGFFSSSFQTTLIGNPLNTLSAAESVAFGSIVSLKNYRNSGGLLHSHYHFYPEEVGPTQQQITAYTYKDPNNMFVVKPAYSEVRSGEVPELLRNGDLFRLEHVATRRNLHSHMVKSPVTRSIYHLQVTGYGNDGQGDLNDIWRVEIVGGKEREVVKTLVSVIRVHHHIIGCALHSHSVQLPKWGWEQLEVTCNRRVHDHGTLWNVEDNEHNQLPTISIKHHQPSFFTKLIEAHRVMAENNNKLKPKEGEVTSQPWQWPINFRGQHFSGGNHRVYLLGNPVIFLLNLIMVVTSIIITIIYIIMRQMGRSMLPNTIEYCNNMLSACGLLLLGWGLHYFPFYLMGRVLYFHHYFPAFLFSCMLSGIKVDFIFTLLSYKLSSYANHIYTMLLLIGALLSVLSWSFIKFSPLSYGMSSVMSSDPRSALHGFKWLDSWEI